ncbi:YDG/SRA domain-containing protein [Streptomyces sp. NPDC059991]|uniref:YDG/SRA domain-containing protein n=1 Tax=Streptomyces sp. NPDC059991 TaxID=3347028 RepID=UPI003695D218
MSALESLTVDRSSGSPARHQPIVLLWAMGRALQQKRRLLFWQDAQQILRPLLEKHCRPNATPDPSYPFVALHRSPLWRLDVGDTDVPQARGSTVRRWLDERNPQGGLEERVYNLVSTDETFRKQAVFSLLRQYFPESAWEDLLIEVGLQEGEFDGYGHPPYIPVNAVFENQRAAFDAKIHRQIQAGISGKQDEDAKSIVLSGGYPDDEDHGDVIVYTGQGGQTEGRHTHDQKLTRGNAALVNNMASGMPVRVLRGAGNHSPFAPEAGIRYDGLYRVEEYWRDTCTEGFIIWRYRLRAIASDSSSGLRPITTPVDAESSAPLLPPQAGAERPGRRSTNGDRIVRSASIAKYLKEVHRHSCQVCGIRIEIPTGAYAEAAHIRPLGTPHNGPDKLDNLLCLCPNHHVEFDFGMLAIDADGMVIRRGSTESRPLRMAPEHTINSEHLKYHRDHIGSQASRKSAPSDTR